MKQFTSHLDFSLTRKRLLMMSKNISRKRSNSRMMVLAPVLLGVTLMFCTSSFDTEGYRISEFASGINGIQYKTERILYFSKDERDKHVNTYPYDDHATMYDNNGNPFTGTRSFYDRMTGETAWEETYENGRLLQKDRMFDGLTSYDELYSVQYDFQENLFVGEQGYDKQGQVVYRIEYNHQDEITHRYGPDGQITWHSYFRIIEEEKWNFLKVWDLNGNLMIDTAHNPRFQKGWNIRYDEEGNVIYEKGAESRERILKLLNEGP